MFFNLRVNLSFREKKLTPCVANLKTVNILMSLMKKGLVFWHIWSFLSFLAYLQIRPKYCGQIGVYPNMIMHKNYHQVSNYAQDKQENRINLKIAFLLNIVINQINNL